MPVRQESLFSYSQLGRKTGNKLKLQLITLAKQKKTAQVRLPMQEIFCGSTVTQHINSGPTVSHCYYC